MEKVFLMLAVFFLMVPRNMYAGPPKKSNGGIIARTLKKVPKLPLEIPKLPLTLYQMLNEEEDPYLFPEFHIIDDFNSPNGLSRAGTAWEMRLSGKGNAEKISDDDQVRRKRGKSLRLDHSLNRNGRATLRLSLSRLDISQANSLIFYAGYEEKKPPGGGNQSRESKGREDNSRVIFVTLRDAKGHEDSMEITGQVFFESGPGADDFWKQIVLPLHDFEGLNFNRLADLEISVMARESDAAGSLWVDDIVFWGFGNIDFESRKDNIGGYPSKIIDEERAQWLWEKSRDAAYAKVFIKEIARDTWKYFEKSRDKKTHLIVDHIRTGKQALVADYTSITNIAMDFLATVSAAELGFIDHDQAVKRVKETLKTLHGLKRWKGFFYNYYNTTDGSVGKRFVSSVDSGWLAIALVVVRQALPELSREAGNILEAFDFSEFLDPENNQIMIGYDEEQGKFTEHHYGLLITEARATSYCAIGKGDLSESHWWFIYRTLPHAWKWQRQEPAGRNKTYDGIEIFQGYYEAGGKKFVPSWGGSLFEFLMPTIVIDEKRLAPEGLGLNNRIATELHRDYAREKGYHVWGVSPAATDSGKEWRYGEFGVPYMGSKGYKDEGVMTPHVSFLALDTLPEDAVQNIRAFFDYPMYGEYGLYDSVQAEHSRVNPQYLALDQGMIITAAANYLKNDVIKGYFHKDPVGKKPEHLLQKESFFKV